MRGQAGHLKLDEVTLRTEVGQGGKARKSWFLRPKLAVIPRLTPR